ncbi:MDR family MFS transporter [Sphaerisporangium corydalis]|uniref:MDR family MFS transporter n=1 Tax=Sphaerisporangium corydalis TaxID=1441875 RepID=A0ABV9ELE3_9ACTN|nr:MDR family MFS transporter [Sphaerisporangium corydalis]
MTTTTEEAPTGFDPALKRMALVVALGAIMTILDTTIVNVAINTLGRDFDTSLSTIQWVITGYTLALSMTIPITGWVVERFGAKTMWLTSLTLFIAGSLLCGIAWSAPSLIAFRVVQGIGGGLLMPVGQSMLAREAGPQRMGRAMAVIAVPGMLAPVLGPVLGGGILDHLAWRWLFYVNVPFCAIALLLAIRLLPKDEDRRADSRLDGVGLALLSPGLAATVYGLSQVGEGDGLTGAGALAGLGAGLVLIVSFVVWSLRRGERALLDLRVFRYRGFLLAVGTLVLYSAAIFGVLVLTPLYYQIMRGASALDAGLLLAPLGVGAIITMPLAGRFTDRLGSRGIGMTGVAVATAGTLALTQIDAATAVPVLAVALFVVGLGHGLILPSMSAAFYQGMPKTSIPAATTVSNIAIRVASSLGVAMLAVVLQIRLRSGVPGSDGTLADAAAHGADAAGAVTQAFSGSFWWAVALGALALVPATLIPRKPTL